MSDKEGAEKPAFALLDDSGFPVVRYRVPDPMDIGRDGYDELLADLDILLARDAPFVMITSGQHDREPPDVRKGRAVWFKANQGRFASRCKAFIHVEPDEDELRRMDEKKESLGEALGVPCFLVSSEADAIRRAAASLEERTPVEYR